MYCAGCGTQIQSGLNYCSRCGRRAADDESKTSKPAWTSPLVIAGNTAGVGFVAYIFVLIVLGKYGVLPTAFLPITLAYFAALFSICFMILRHGRAVEKSAEAPANNNLTQAPAYLRPVTTAQLEDARDMGVGSVTDATTRTLDQVPIERK